MRCCSLWYLTTNYIISSNIIEPTSLVFARINVELNCQFVSILNIELFDTILTKNVKHTTLWVLTWYFKNILLGHPSISRTG